MKNLKKSPKTIFENWTFILFTGENFPLFLVASLNSMNVEHDADEDH